MGNRLAMVLLFALGVSAAACFLLYRMLAHHTPSAAAVPSTRLLVASRALPVATLLKDSDFHQVDWQGPLPQHALSDPKLAANRGVNSPIYEGEPLVEERLAPVGAGVGLAAEIPLGMRAVAVRTNDVVGVSGFATPGMRVDVLIFGIVPASPPNEGTRARTLLQNIQVLSAGQEIQKTADGKPLPVQVVNLLVSPQQAEVLSLASNDARIQLVLRNPMDAANAETAGTSLGELLSGTRSSQPVQRRNAAPPVIKVSAPPRPAPVVVEVILGTHRDFEKFGEKTPEPPANPSGGPPPMPISVQSLQQNTSQAMSQLLTHAGQASLAGAQPANSLAGAPRQ